MENLYNFNSFLEMKNSIRENKLVSEYLSNKISINEFDNQFNNQFINEDVGDWLKKVLDWVMGIFKSIINSPEAYYLKEGGKKVFNILRKVFDYIRKFKEKHPVIFKCVVIFLIIILIFIATAAAAAGGDNSSLPDSVYNMALGLLDSIQSEYPSSGKYSDFDFIEAKAYLIKLREHELHITSYEFQETSKNLANAAIETIKQSIGEYNETHSDSMGRALFHWMEEGSKMVLLKLEQLGSSGGMHKAIEIGLSGAAPPTP